MDIYEYEELGVIRTPEPFLPRYGPKCTSLIFRIIMLSICLSVPISKYIQNFDLGYLNMSNWAVAFATITYVIAIFHYFSPNKRTSAFTTVFKYCWASHYPALFVISVIVFVNNHVFHWGDNAFDNTYDTIVEHVVIPSLIFVPYIYEYIDLTVLPYIYGPIGFGILYLTFNCIWTLTTKQPIYIALIWTDQMSYVWASAIMAGGASGFFIGWAFGYCIRKSVEKQDKMLQKDVHKGMRFKKTDFMISETKGDNGNISTHFNFE